jgi:hypothetical protein
MIAFVLLSLLASLPTASPSPSASATPMPQPAAIATPMAQPAAIETPAPASSATGTPGPLPKAGARPLSAEPLKEIGRVHAMTTFCTAIVDHATLAVTDDIDNDGEISKLVIDLRNLDFDSSELAKRKSLATLSSLYTRFVTQAVAAEHAAKALRVDAKKAPTDERAKSVTAFADSLDGALHRQRTIARDLASILAMFDNQPQMSAQERDQMLIDAQLAGAVFTPQGAIFTSPPPPLADVAKKAAENFVYRESGIVDDERAAADLIAPAFGDC